MDNVTFRRRNRLKKHFVITSNVLLFGYSHVSDSAKVTYQVIDSFDWQDGQGLRKGFAYPSVETLASIRSVTDRTIQRHIEELVETALLTKEERPGYTNLLYIEDVSDDEAHRYEERFARGDNNVTRRKTKMSPEERQREERLNDVVQNVTFSSKKHQAPSDDEREGLVHEMLSVLQDTESESYYRRLAATVPKDTIFETLSLVKRAVHEGKIRKSRGALFVAIVKRTCADRGLPLQPRPAAFQGVRL
ncbi:MAG: helix-turn-helix domain-containing protein [Chloroflexi bacterium]|nr:helix-turn-helix domain-containing protein [Chloroflexota bacterium]